MFKSTASINPKIKLHLSKLTTPYQSGEELITEDKMVADVSIASSKAFSTPMLTMPQIKRTVKIVTEQHVM